MTTTSSMRAALCFADRSVRATRIDQFAEDRAAWFEFMPQPQHGCGDRAGFRTGQAHHADAAASGRCGDGNDGVVEVHSCTDPLAKHRTAVKHRTASSPSVNNK